MLKWRTARPTLFHEFCKTQVFHRRTKILQAWFGLDSARLGRTPTRLQWRPKAAMWPAHKFKSLGERRLRRCTWLTVNFWMCLAAQEINLPSQCFTDLQVNYLRCWLGYQSLQWKAINTIWHQLQKLDQFKWRPITSRQLLSSEKCREQLWNLASFEG